MCIYLSKHLAYLPHIATIFTMTATVETDNIVNGLDYRES